MCKFPSQQNPEISVSYVRNNEEGNEELSQTLFLEDGRHTGVLGGKVYCEYIKMNLTRKTLDMPI
jgi:hypothetical protein